MKAGRSTSRIVSPLHVHALTLALLGVVSGAAPVSAQQQQPQPLGFRGWGLRGGATIDPDQIHVGVHINAGEFAPRVRFQPSFEIGFGNDLIVGAINLDALYMPCQRPNELRNGVHVDAG